MVVYNGSKPYEQMDDLRVFPYFWKQPYMILRIKTPYIGDDHDPTSNRKSL